jgi:hypothetical protein
MGRAAHWIFRGTVFPFFLVLQTRFHCVLSKELKMRLITVLNHCVLSPPSFLLPVFITCLETGNAERERETKRAGVSSL